MKNLDKCLPISRCAELATLLDPATVSLLGSADNNKEDMLYAAITDSQAAQPTSSGDRQGQPEDDGEQAEANCSASSVSQLFQENETRSKAQRVCAIDRSSCS